MEREEQATVITANEIALDHYRNGPLEGKRWESKRTVRIFKLYTTDSEDYDASLGVPLGNWYIALPGVRRAVKRMPPNWQRWNQRLDAGMTIGDMLRARGMAYALVNWD